MRYQIPLYWNEEDSAFTAEVPELPGCLADAETYREALENAQVAMQQWIDTARELGRTISET